MANHFFTSLVFFTFQTRFRSKLGKLRPCFHSEAMWPPFPKFSLPAQRPQRRRNMSSHSHRPGTLHQTNKPFKSKHSSKGQVKETSRGRVERAHAKGPKSHQQNKADRRNAAKQLQRAKREVRVRVSLSLSLARAHVLTHKDSFITGTSAAQPWHWQRVGRTQDRRCPVTLCRHCRCGHCRAHPGA